MLGFLGFKLDEEKNTACRFGNEGVITLTIPVQYRSGCCYQRRADDRSGYCSTDRLITAHQSGKKAAPRLFEAAFFYSVCLLQSTFRQPLSLKGSIRTRPVVALASGTIVDQVPAIPTGKAHHSLP